MMDWISDNITNILLFEFIIIICFFRWTKEIILFISRLPIYIAISYVVLKWSFYLGNKSFYITYKDPTDEPGEIRVIEFPAIWM